MPSDWEGYPLRKDYPVHGYKYSYQRMRNLHERSFEDHVATRFRADRRKSRRRPAAPRRMTLNMGPQHPSTHGVLRIVLELEGETILGAVPDIGFLHTGIEKECEVKTWQQVVTLTDRVDYLANLSNNLVYALAVEKLICDIEIPPKAQWTARDDGRVFAAEQPPGLAGNARAGYRRDERVFLLLPRARRHSAHFRDVLRPAHDDQLHPHRRLGAGASARLAASGGEVHQRVPEQSGRIRRICWTRNPIWMAAPRALDSFRSKICWTWASPGR